MIGKILDGRYEIIRKLGQGAFGTTYLAIDRKLPDKDQCVVKHFSPQSTDSNTLSHARRLFETEAKVLNRLGNHNQIPRLLAHFEEEQQFYLVEEYVEGHDLSREITYDKRWNEQDVISLLLVILEVLQFVHQNNVIHRDIKPSNLIRREQDGKIFLVDFGAVKQISSHTVTSQEDGGLTVAIGTRGYMPSEQSQGIPKLCSDIYAVGIIGIQALTGLPATQLATDSLTGEIIWNEQKQVNPKLAEILGKMIRYDFRQRYQSATEALSALQSLKPAHSSSKLIGWKAAISLVTATAAILITSWLFFVPRNNLEVYQNTIYGIKIKYPQKWQKSVTPDRITGNLAKFMPPQLENVDYQDNINLIVRDLPENLQELQKFTNYYLNDIKQLYQDVNIIQQEKTLLSNQPAYKVIYTTKDNENNIQRLQIWTVKNTKAYVITYTASPGNYSKYSEIIQLMINSFEIK
ncbi:MAG: protein kinase [Calothrix sp. MO_167.B12]|nr:protein kinase [Calothrix sp. MO_167.B12]